MEGRQLIMVIAPKKVVLKKDEKPANSAGESPAAA
jgi:hypothetical protein